MINGSIQRGGRKFLGHFIRHNLWQITNIIRIVQTGTYEANKPKICNRKLLSDISSRSNFWLSNRARFLGADVGKTINCTEDSPIYRLNQSLSLQMLASFARSYMTLFEWFWWYLWPKMAYKMPQALPTVSLDWLLINYELKELCQLGWGTRVRLSEIKHVLVGSTLLSLLQVFHVYAEKVHIQSA